MLNLYSAQIEELYIHKVGNKTRSEGALLSERASAVTDELMPLLKEYFFKPFREKDEDYYRFEHEADLEFHPLYRSCARAFQNSRAVLEISKDIAKLMYQQHNHPHIKSGEIYVCSISNITIDQEKVSGLGIFKSEIRQDFLQFKEQENMLELMLLQGVNLQKLDKGCLILNVEKDDGYRVLSIDNNKYDTKYWKENFLGIVPAMDGPWKTKKYLKFCEDFSKNIVRPEYGRQEEVEFMNRSLGYFAQSDEFQEADFLGQVLEDPGEEPQWHEHKNQRGAKYGIADTTSFEIDSPSVTVARKKYTANRIELDTGYAISVPKGAAASGKFLEKGWDEERQMYYYLTYFNKETK